MSEIRFDGRVAIVTGAGSGIGRCHALMLASRGARVVVNDLGTTVDGRGQRCRSAEGVISEIRAAGGEAVANDDDISCPCGAARLADQAVDEFGRLDILVNNAGILRDKTFSKMELADFQKVLDVHLLGSVYCTKAAWGRMTSQGYGRIVVTTSSSGLYGHFGQTNYDAAKLGLVGFMKGLALEGRRNDVLVNAVAPLAATRMSDGVLDVEAFARMAPEHVSAVVAYLASEQCNLSGEIMVAGGGYLARAAIVESQGVVLPAENPSPEAVAGAVAAASELAQAVAYPDLSAAFAAAVSKIDAARQPQISAAGSSHAS